MLSGNSSEWSTDRAYIPCPTVTLVKWFHTVIQTVRHHQKGGRWTSTKKNIMIKDLEIDKYTYLRGNFTAQSNIHDGPFLQK